MCDIGGSCGVSGRCKGCGEWRDLGRGDYCKGCLEKMKTHPTEDYKLPRTEAEAAAIELPNNGSTCDGCPYQGPEEYGDSCHGPQGPPPPEDANCYEDWAEQRREAEEEDAYIESSRQRIMGG